jgi:hypothetical protein
MNPFHAGAEAEFQAHASFLHFALNNWDMPEKAEIFLWHWYRKPRQSGVSAPCFLAQAISHSTLPDRDLSRISGNR